MIDASFMSMSMHVNSASPELSNEVWHVHIHLNFVTCVLKPLLDQCHFRAEQTAKLIQESKTFQDMF